MRVNAKFHRHFIPISNDYMLARRSIADDIRDCINRFADCILFNSSSSLLNLVADPKTDSGLSLATFKQTSWDRVDFIAFLFVPVCAESNNVSLVCWRDYLNELYANCMKYLVFTPTTPNKPHEYRQLGALYLLYLIYECTHRQFPIRLPHSYAQQLSATFDQMKYYGHNDAQILVSRLLDAESFHLVHHDETLFELVHYMRQYDGEGGRFPCIDDYSSVHSSAVLENMESTESQIIVDWLDSCKDFESVNNGLKKYDALFDDELIDEYMAIKSDLQCDRPALHLQRYPVPDLDIREFKQKYSDIWKQMRLNFSTTFKQVSQEVPQEEPPGILPVTSEQSEEQVDEFLKYVSVCDDGDGDGEYWEELEQLIRDNSQFIHSNDE